MTAHVLEANGISKRYGAVSALADVSLRVGGGRFVTLLGPSGSGKTTLLMAIAGFVQPDSGSLLLDGAPITHLPPEKRNFGMVFQGYALFPHLSVADNVAFPLQIRRVGRAEVAARVKAALDLVQLAPLAGRMPRQLSGGQQQRVALARALVFRPSLLLLDEPLSALDKTLRLSMQEELRDLHGRVGLSFVFVTHDQGEALALSDEVAILRGGRLVQAGSPADLYERPANRFVAGFLGRSNFWSGRVAAQDAAGFTYMAGGHRPAPGGPSGGRGGAGVVAAGKAAGAGRRRRPGEPGRRHGRHRQLWRGGLAGAVGRGRAGPDASGAAHLAPGAAAAGEAIRLGWDADASVIVDDSEGDAA